MALESMMLYSCAICGNAMCGMEWEDSPSKSPSGKDYNCPSCGQDINEDELYKED